jgi:WD40 repeat protein
MSVAGFHSGKNIWSTTLFQPTSDQQQVICGAADSKITAFPLPISPIMGDSSVPEYTVWDILKMSKLDTGTQPSEKEFTTKLADFFRGYAFLGPTSFLLTTNSGKICLVTMTEDRCGSATARISSSELVEQLDELSSYSVCTSGSVLGNGGISFVAGAKGGIYMYRSGSAKLLKIHTVQGKVGNMFTTRTTTLPETEKIVLLITLMGQKLAKLLYIDTVGENEPLVTRAADLHFSDQITGGTVTSMEYITTDNEEDYICLGFRGGSVAGYTLAKRASAEDNDGIKPAFIERVHGKEAVTSMLWFPSRQYSSYGNLVSVGRDGCCAIHHIEFSASTLSLVHFLPLPVGPNIEGLYYLHGALIAYGFSSTKFIVYNITTEEEVMSVGTGGSHRSWSFRPHTSQEGGGTLIWTRASTMHIFTQKGPNHAVIRPGGHGREIKSVAISENYFNREDGRKLIATGAEDTDIKIFEYAAGGESGAEGAFLCRRTLRKHNTGIQQLKWSDNGAYLFSSGGCEEFYVWRVRNLPGALGIGIICESVCPPESEASDVRLTSFDVRRQAENAEADGCFVIAMVFSDSKIRVYTYTPTATAAEGKWNMLGKGTYFTSCLTQCVVLSPHTLLTTGTDGHAVFWTLPSTTTTADEKKHTATKELAWHHPSRIHQNTSKTLDTHLLPDGSTLVASGGDDGSLALLLTPLSPAKEAKGEGGLSYPHPPVVLLRAHASAITACTILSHDSRIYVLTSGNDQWIRLWQVDILANSSLSETEPEAVDANQDVLRVKRVKKIKTNVADVSSMAVLEESRDAAKVVVCGVGMEVLNVQWDG